MLLSNPLVSCCISTWNRVDDLRRCVESIQAQSYPNIEIVIVDNCSSDGTFEYCMELGCVYHRMEDSKSSAMETLNLAFSMASGDYILVMDDDAELIDNYTIDKLINFMAFDDNVGIIGTNIIDDYNNPQMVYRSLSGHEMNYTKRPFYYFDFKGACAMFKVSLIKPLNYYNESFKLYMNEFDLSCRVMKSGYYVVIYGGINVLHHGTTRFGNSMQYLNNYNNVLYNNFYKSYAIKMMGLNYFIVSYYCGGWIRNAWITMKWMGKLLFRNKCNCIPWFWQLSLLNGTIQSIKEFINDVSI